MALRGLPRCTQRRQFVAPPLTATDTTVRENLKSPLGQTQIRFGSVPIHDLSCVKLDKLWKRCGAVRHPQSTTGQAQPSHSHRIRPSRRKRDLDDRLGGATDRYFGGPERYLSRSCWCSLLSPVRLVMPGQGLASPHDPPSPVSADPCKTIGWPLRSPLKLFPVRWFLGPIPPLCLFLLSVSHVSTGVLKG